MCPRWNRVLNCTGLQPKPRHGHRAVAIKELIVIFAGGNEGILSDLIVFNTQTNHWFKPSVQGHVPDGRASYGFVVDKTRIIMFGGMMEYMECTNDLFELQASRWEWKKLYPRPPDNKPPPAPRLGHSFTLIGDKVYLFGGLTYDRQHYRDVCSHYLNDFYTLEWHNDTFSWNTPSTYGQMPSPRESHSAVAHIDSDGTQRLIIYGGMSGHRLGDLWVFVVNAMSWIEVETSGSIPLPRSLHTATIVKNHMFVFGGWVPVLSHDSTGVISQGKDWKVSNQLLCFDVSNMSWKESDTGSSNDIPKARAGHAAVVVNERIYIWSGRDGYRRAWTNQVCCNDLWYIDIDIPPATPKPQLLKGDLKSFELHWTLVTGVEHYLLQICKMDIPLVPNNIEKNSLKLCLPKSNGIPNLKSTPSYSSSKCECANGSESKEKSHLIKTPIVNTPPLLQLSILNKEPDLNFNEPITSPHIALPHQKLNILATKAQQVIHKSPTQECQPATSKSVFTLVSKVTNFENQIPLLRPFTMPMLRLGNAKGIAEIGQKTFAVTRATNFLKLGPITAKTTKPKTFIVKNPGFKLVAVNKDSQIKLVPSHSSHITNKHYINASEKILRTGDLDNSETSVDYLNKKIKLSSNAISEIPSSESLQTLPESQANKIDTKDEKVDLKGGKVEVPSFPEQVQIKKCNTTEGISLSWIPSPGDVVTAYKVTLFVKESVSPTGQKIVYNGVKPECFIYKAHLDNAHVDDSGGTRAVKFSISASNCKGSGPALIVKWVIQPTQFTN